MYKNIPTHHIREPLFDNAGIDVHMLRLDLIDPDISGNKWFKLRYHLEDASARGKTGILSFGGPYSNHLVALAKSCLDKGLRSAAFIRGEYENNLNPSLHQMAALGMELQFVSRSAYNDRQKLADVFLNGNPGYYVVPEGGKSAPGIRGASQILAYAEGEYSHVVCAVGTGTTLAGIADSLAAGQTATGICSLNATGPAAREVLEFAQANTLRENWNIIFDYGFGGFGKRTDALIEFMNTFYRAQGVPTDFVYTGKLMYALYDLARQGYFPAGSEVLAIHSGGLQGNRSLPAGTLHF